MKVESIIKNNIGEPLLISRVGSHAYGTTYEKSDIDYFSIVNTEERFYIDMMNKLKIDNIDIFYLPYQSFKELSAYSSLLFIGDLVNLIYIKEELSEFLNENKSLLMNISPKFTYENTLDFIEHDFQWEIYYRIFIFADILRTFVKTGDFSKCFPVSEPCRQEVLEIKAGKIYTEEEIREKIKDIYDDSFREKFEQYPTNISLCTEFYNLILKTIGR